LIVNDNNLYLCVRKKVGRKPTFISYKYLKLKILHMSTVLFLSPAVVIIILLVILLLFGGKKIPELFKGIGQGIKGFKDEMKDDKDNRKIEK
jgi:sec-independent protein translocase protein TatA